MTARFNYALILHALQADISCSILLHIHRIDKAFG